MFHLRGRQRERGARTGAGGLLLTVAALNQQAGVCSVEMKEQSRNRDSRLFVYSICSYSCPVTS